MKKLFTLLFCGFISLAKSQAPQKISYQGIARSATGQIVASQPIGVKFDLHQGSASGTVVFSETHASGTNPFGLFTLAIGSTNPSSFTSINWSSGPYFLEVSIDPTGGTSYTSVGNQQLMSVPYALYAEKSGNSTPNPTLSINAPNTISNPSTGVYNINVANPSLSVNSNSLSISNGNTVILPTGTTYSAGTGIDVTGGVISNTAPNQTVNISGANVAGSYPNYTVNSQTLSITGNTLDISNGNSVVLPAGVTYTAGSGIDLTGNIVTNTAPNQTVNISGANVAGSYPNYTVNSTPAQTLALTGNTLDISNGNSVVLPTGTTYTAGSGIDLTGNIVTNTNPDQVVSLFGIGGATVTGSYPNYTVNVQSGTSLPAGYNGQIMFHNGTVWDTIPQQYMYYSGDKLGIGTTNPQSELHVDGAGRFNASVTTPQIYTNAIHIAVGTFTNAGDVLTNDGAGNAVWQTPISTTPTITSTGIAVVTPTTGNTFNVNVPVPVLSYTAGTNVLSLSQGTTVTTATLNGTGSNTVSMVGAGLATVTPTTGSTFTVSVPNPTFTTNGPTSITGSYPNYTVNSVTSPTTSIVSTNTNISVASSAGVFSLTAVSSNLFGDVVGAVNSTTVTQLQTRPVSNIAPTVNQVLTWNGSAWTPSTAVTSPSTSLVQGNNVLLTNAGNTYTVSSITPTLTVVGGTLAGPYPTQTLTIPASSLTTITGSTNISVIGSPSSYTLSSPSQSLSISGNTLSISGSNSVTIPTSTIAGLGTGIATVTTSVNNFTVNVPSPAFAPSTGVLSFGTNTLNIAPTLSLSGTTLSSGATSNSVSLSNLSVWSNSVGVLYPTTLTNSVAIGTNGPTTGKFEILHSATVTNPTAHFRETSAASLVRLKFSNNTVPSKFFEVASDNNASDNNAAFSVNYHNGSNYRPVFLVYGNYKTVIHNLNTPLTSLHVMDTSSTGGIASEGFNKPGFMVLARNNQPGLGARLAVSAGDELGRLSFSGYNGSSYGSGPKIFARALEAYTGSGNGSELIFTTVKVGTTSEQEVLKLLANGNVVVNPMQMPNAILDVRGNMRLDSSLTMAAYNSPPYQSLLNEGRIYFDRPSQKFKVSENGGAYVDLIGGGTSPWIQGTGIITQNNLGDFVGIGTSTPTAPLHVYGMADPLQMTVENTGGNFRTGYHIKTALGEWFMGQDGPASTGFRITDKLASAVRLQIDPVGNVGIGTTTPGFKLDVADTYSISGGRAVNVYAASSSSSGANSVINANLEGSSTGNYISGYFRSASIAGGTGNLYGVKGLAVGSSGTFGNAVGLDGNGQGANQNYGVSAIANGTMGVKNYGIYAEASSVGTNYAVYALANSTVGTNYAGYFDGAVYTKGTTSSSSGFALRVQNSGSTELFNVRNDGNVGVNVTNPGFRLSVVETTNTLSAIYGSNSTAASSSSAHGVYGLTSNTGTLSAGVYGDNSGAGPAIFGNKSTSNGIAGLFKIASTTNAADALFARTDGGGAAIHAVSGPTVTGGTNVAMWLESGHLKTTGATPTYTIPLNSASVTGNDIVGTVSLTLASSTTVNQNMITIFYNKPYSSVPNVMLHCNNANAFNANAFVTGATTSSFTITFASSVAAAVYSFKYLVIE